MKDEFGTLVRRDPDENYRYIFTEGAQSDAAPMMRALGERLRGIDAAIDVGANVGLVSIWLARRARRVFAFEPVPANRERLAEHLELNKIDNVEIDPRACGDRPGEREMTLREGYGHHSFGAAGSSSEIGKTTVGVVRLDDFLREREIETLDFLKIDVEGFEDVVLAGAEEILDRRAARLVALEHAAPILRRLGKDLRAVPELLERKGYVCRSLAGERLALEAFDDGQFDFYAEPPE
jgi:FkbM family methyltransferase